MKKYFFMTLLSTAFFLGKAQDSTIVLNFSLKTKTIANLAPIMSDPSNDVRFTIFLKWRTALRANSSATTIVTDTIPTTVLADIYNTTLYGNDGWSASSDFKGQIAAARAANHYLDTICTNYEAVLSQQLTDRIKQGRRLLLGK